MALIHGDDGVLDDPFPYTIYNEIKNHWRQNDPIANLTNPRPGMIVDDSADDKLYHITGTGPLTSDEILQLTNSADVSPLFTTVKLSALTDGYIPHHVSDAAGLADSVIFTDGTNIGVTTADIEAWNNVYRAIEFTDSAIMFGAVNNFIGLMSNAYFDGAWKYKANDLAANYYMSSGEHFWNIAVDGVINNPITWVTAMKIDTSGRVTIPSGFLSIAGPEDVVLDAAGAMTATQTWMRVDNFAAAANDDIVTINGGAEGDLLILTSKDDARNPRVTEAGNILLDFLLGNTFTFDIISDTMLFMKIGANWCEISRSNN